jgi:hypothetical protein
MGINNQNQLSSCKYVVCNVLPLCPPPKGEWFPIKFFLKFIFPHVQFFEDFFFQRIAIFSFPLWRGLGGGLLLTFCLSIYSIAFSQMLNNQEGDAFLESPFFNQENIKANKIKKISGTYHFKRINDRMRPLGLIYGCEFDQEGRMVMQYETTKFLDRVDTTVNLFEYNEQGLLHIHRKYDANAYYAEVYQYDNEARVIRIEYRKDINKNANPLRFVLEKQYLISFETMAYERYEQQEKKTHFNNFGLPFQYSFFYRNDLGYLTQIVENMAVSSGQRTTTFSYNERGLIAEKRMVSSVMGNSSYKITYVYDQIGNLLSSELYRNGVYTTETQVIYNSKTGLVSSLLKRQIDTQLITILQLDNYEFY